ncbi:Pkinase domain-containing protein [Trichoderma novae-zelandiae]
MDAEQQQQGTQPTQATQTVLDPRRIGKQNSGFSDDDVSDIICVLYPHSQAARLEVQQLAANRSPYIIGKDEADGVEPDYDVEDDASRFEEMPPDLGSYALILRLSSQVKNPAAGFQFGRNSARCDVVFVNDPLRRVSNIHFRIYINEYGTVMIEDHSTNGTTVDSNLLMSRPRDRAVANDPDRKTKWMLSSGSIVGIYLQDMRSLSFRVRIPRRENEFDLAYQRRVDAYFARQAVRGPVETITTGPGGHVDLFKTAAQAAQAALRPPDRQPSEQRSPSKRKEARVPQRQWTGSGKYNKIGMIGKGAFAVVYKVTSKYNGVPYAAKELEKRRFIKNGVLDQKVENEMRIMQKVDHPNIVRYIENFDWDERLLIIIMEYVPGGDLGKHIADDMPFTESDSREMAKQLLSALSYLHANNITHRDVKPDNILINSLQPLDVKLTDFGLSKMVDTEQTFLRTFCGTLLYCAPEVYTEYAEYDENGIRSRGKKARRVPGQRYNHAVDIWSLGGVLFYSMTGQPPYPVKSGISYSELLHKIMTTLLDIRPLEKASVSDDGIDFICSMLQRKPENRGTIDELFRHPWLTPLYIQASQSFDVVSDDEGGISDPPPEYREHEYAEPFEFDRVSDSNGEEEEEEEGEEGEVVEGNGGGGQNKGKGPANSDPANEVAEPTMLIHPTELATEMGTQPPRLFGEVGASAVGSSGVVPEDHLNLPVTDEVGSGSDGGSGGAEREVDGAYDSGDSGATLVKQNSRRFLRHGTSMSIGRHQSADQLQSLVEDVASQKLDGNESAVKNSDPTTPTTPSMDSNTSKRKTSSSLEASDELDVESTPTGKPVIKRLKSESFSEDVSAESLEEYRLLASMPPMNKSNSGRQIDRQVTKQMFWQQDRSTWHLNYPEMTQLQYDAFVQAARTRKEVFGPNNKPLWDLAMRYFPPTPPACSQNGRAPEDEDVSMEFPATGEQLRDEDLDIGRPDTQRVVPVQTGNGGQAIGILSSHKKSCIQKIESHITDSLISFGRGLGNTVVFEPKSDTRVPKNAFKILLWKDGYDPAKDAHPWKDDTVAGDSYFFWISSKATRGISVNGQNLASSNPARPAAPSVNWTKIYNGDTLDLWNADDGKEQTKLVFQCLWGGSARKRQDPQKRLEMASVAVAKVLDIACQRTERRIREAALKQAEERSRESADRQAERQRKISAAEADYRERLRRVDAERNRSHVFEQSRLAAIQFLDSRRGSLSRKSSYAGYSIR